MTKIVRATDDLFTAEYRIRDGITETRSFLTGTTPDDDWVTSPQFQNRKTLGGFFYAPDRVEEVARILSINLGKHGNFQTVEIVDA